MAEFQTPKAAKSNGRSNNQEFQTPIRIPATPFLKQIGYGCGVNVFTLERSPRVGFARSPLAVKKRNRNIIKDTKYLARLMVEADILRKLQHPNVIDFRGLTKDANGDPCLVMEKLDISLGDLIEQKVEEGEEQFPAKEILKIGFEIAKGLEYLHHTAYILHGDIKSFNILLSRDYSTVKICDFGVAIPLTKDLETDPNHGTDYVGTPCWTPPEVINGDGPVTNKADIWSYGLVLWEMIALSPPHVSNEDDSMTGMSDDSMLECKKINDSQDTDGMEDSFLQSLNDPDEDKYGTRPPLPAIDLGQEYGKVLELFYACTEEDHKTRPSAKGVVMFFNNYVYNQTKKV